LLEDVEAGVVVLEGDELAAELRDSPVRESPESFVRLGLVWDAENPRAVEISASVHGETWSPWRAPVVHPVEVENTTSFVGQIELDEAPANFYRLRGSDSAATFVRLELLTTTQSDSLEDGEDGPGESTARLIGAADVNERSEWGARSTRCSSSLGDAWRMAIHHTETPTNDSISPQARLRQIQSYHMDVRGWCDIGYHYLMSRDGRLWEGRPGYLRGAHAGGGNNTGNIGVSVMGSHGGTQITDTQLASIASLVRGLAGDHGVELNRTRIKGHREYKSTSCPGNALFGQLDEIVARARDGGGGGGGDDGGGDGGECAGVPLASDGAWSCAGLTGTTTNTDRVYYTTSFGCWVDEDGDPHGDADDNCLPACSLSSIGCSGMSGPECERAINWYAADSDRFGCGTLIKVTNPDTGASAVLKVIDRGPSCTIENLVDHWVLDMSYRASYFLFGEPTSATERADVIVDIVPDGTPLGPVSGDVCDGEPPDESDPGSPDPDTVTVLGVLYAGSDTSNRLVGATVTLDGRTATTNSVGLWKFEGVSPGAFTVSASASGYEPRSISRTTYADESWASFGLSELGGTGTAVLQGVVYRTSDSSNRIAFAELTLSTGHTATADANGFYKLTGLPAGDVAIEASAAGYPTVSVARDLVDGETTWGSVRLE
jgi:hypothetical protein